VPEGTDVLAFGDEVGIDLDFDGRTARIRFARTAPAGTTSLQPVCDTGLSAAAGAGAGQAGVTGSTGASTV
jgi:hypothetical protein